MYVLKRKILIILMRSRTPNSKWLKSVNTAISYTALAIRYVAFVALYMMFLISYMIYLID